MPVDAASNIKQVTSQSYGAP